MKITKEESTELITPFKKAKICAQEAADYKARDLILLNVSKICSFADYFLICSGKSSRQVQGIVDHIEANLRRRGIKALGIEGRREGQWVLMDYEDVIVHVFYESVRPFYDLESLWSDAQKMVLETEGVAPETTRL